MANVYTGGTFDLLHVGHLELLEACRRMAGPNLVVVGLNTDEFIERFKGSPPAQSYDERKTMLQACRYVDQVEMNIGEEDSKMTIEKFRDDFWPKAIDIVAIGTDWATRDYYAQMGFTKEWLDKNRIVLVYVDRRTGQSTSAIKEKLKNTP